ncbi:hypothetical protein PHYPSEUDO_012269 [Phytophthora pseudosyringae]|uniref:Uncharacterized protein n=1 Tax=Phytophthora pseudosyringae TaxID=221518 RepID=A0A8T1VBW5_9STRA|nr:hypothetical protein PHYPSEUDO_012269 [Phytophthora pseudosyringae]
MRAVFDVDQFETENRKFVNEVKTYGYAASITMTRPLTTISVAVVESTDSKKKRNKTNDGAVPPTGVKNPKQKKRRHRKRLRLGIVLPRSCSSLDRTTFSTFS